MTARKRGKYRKNYLVRAVGGWRYRRGIPVDLLPAFGKRREWSHWLGNIGQDEAERLARAHAVADDARIATLKALTPAERLDVVEHGADPAAWERYLDGREIGAKFVYATTIHTGPSPEDSEDEQAADALEIHRARVQAAQMRTEVRHGRKTLRKLRGKGDALVPLLDVWRGVAKPRSPQTVKKYRLYLHRFSASAGEGLEPRDVRPDHVRKWRDELAATHTAVSATKHLEALNAIFRAARSVGAVDMVPGDGITATAGERQPFADDKDKRAFSAEDVAKIFKAAESETADFKWMVRLLAYHGARSGELAQLRVEDVKVVDGVPVLSIHDRHGSLKNKHSVREIPIHPKCRGLVEYARQRNGDWLFGTFLVWKGRRGEYFQRKASTWLRTSAGITDPALTMHSFRHRWRDAARALQMPTAASRATMGHKLGKDVHDEYGGPPPVRVLAKWMAKVNPLA